jgi:hypothetical protein
MRGEGWALFVSVSQRKAPNPGRRPPRVQTPFFRLWGPDLIGRFAHQADHMDMAHYLCPHCEDVVDFDGRSRVTWCNGCGQPLSMFDLLPLRPAIAGERAESQEEAPPALA